MALAKWTMSELEAIADSLEEAAKKIKVTCGKMKLSGHTELILQAHTALSIYAPSLCNLAGTIDSEFEDQFNAVRFDRIPRWEMNRRKVEERTRRNAARAKQDAGREVKPTAARKAAEKKARKV